MMNKYWIFKVLSGLPKAETKFDDFEEMKSFSASLSDMYPDVVSDYECKIGEIEAKISNILPCSQERIDAALKAASSAQVIRCLDRSIANNNTENISLNQFLSSLITPPKVDYVNYSMKRLIMIGVIDKNDESKYVIIILVIRPEKNSGIATVKG